MPRDLVRPLEDAWQDVIDSVLRRRGAPATRDVAKLAPRLVELSHAYNAGLAGDGARARVPLDARIAFSFARDVPKGAAAVRELVRAGALPLASDRTLRIVDLGAGLGAMTWGIVRALSAAGATETRVEALLVDEDADVLAAAESIAHEAATRLGASASSLSIRTRKERLAPGMKLPEADVVVLGQVLSELDVAMDPAARATKHAELAADLLARVVAPDGALVIVEPALRERTRHLHAVRDALVASGTTVFAPCLHAERCPVLATAGEWCHEDLPIDLPAWVVPLARAAGLRWQGLTFSYLVLRRDTRRLVGELDRTGSAPRLHLRVISELMRTKGKAEVFACTSTGERLRLRRLDRDAVDSGPGAEATASWSKLGRGDVVTLTGEAGHAHAADANVKSDAPSAAPAVPPVDGRGRLSSTAQIDVWPIRK
jgi:ribosomal protein RSM22 (predicted rRNA methylase)